MKKMSTLLLIVFSCLALSSFAQNKTGKLTGKVTAIDGASVNGASVSVLRAKDSSLAKLAVASTSGQFEVDRLAAGNYLVKVTAVGFQPYMSKPVEVSDNATATVETIALTASNKQFSEVTVTGKRPLIENKLDRMVVNVEASTTNTGISALEVLEKSPGVTVDNDGNISVKGKSGVIILIDGKQTYLGGQDLANYLRNMPSNQLDQIEIMTQPSAKYDASGNSGIINFKTKKNRADGFNGSVSTSAIVARYFKNTNSVNVNWRKGKVNVFGNYGYSWWKGFNEINITRQFRTNKKTDFNRYSDQYTYGKFSGFPHNFKAGVDYFATKQTTVGFSVNGLIDKREFASESNSVFSDSLYHRDQYNTSKTVNNDPWTNVGFNLNLRQLIGKKGAELTADADYIFYSTKGRQSSDNYLYEDDSTLSPSTADQVNPYLLRGYLPAHIDIYSFKSDFTLPLKGDMKLEAGIKSSFVKTDNDAQYTVWNDTLHQWTVDNGRSNHFIYEENINAAYANISNQWKKWGLQVGLRSEQTVAKGNQLASNSTFKLNYTKLFPTTYISYKYNDNSTFGLSYGRRIERPGYQDLNPFQYLLDRYTYRQGNPLLQPQFSHNIELSYNYKGALNFVANYTTTSDIINDIIKNVKTGDNFTTFQTKENVASRKNIGLAVSFNKQIKKWWSINLWTNVYNNYFKGIVNNEPISVNVTAVSANAGNQFSFNKGWSAELSGFFNSKNLYSSVIVAQPTGMFSVGAGKQLFNNKLSVRLNLRDPFWLMKFRGITEMETFTGNIRSKWDNRRYILTLVYRFGKGTSQQRKRKGAADEEASRVNLQNQQ